MNELTLIVPFYRNILMLKRHVEEWNKYPEGVKVICVDDGSPEPALPVIMECRGRPACRPTRADTSGPPLQLCRITKDIPWNRGGARNLGAYVAATDWILHVDIDHILPAESAFSILNYPRNPKRWYRFPRWRVGKADETRKKDRIGENKNYGQIHPHVDSYLVRRKTYWKTGGYDEDFSGAIGGGNEFLRRLENHQPVELLPPPIRLEVYTRDVIKDASDWSLSRDNSRYKALRRQKEMSGNPQPKNPLRFPWVREL